MKTQGTVISTSGKSARVLAFRSSACKGCEGCKNKDSCHTELMFSDSPKSFELEVDNSLGAKKGDTVEISSSGNGILVFAVILFILPIILSVISYFVADAYLSGYYPVAIFACVFLLTFIIGAFLLNKVISLVSVSLISKIIKESSSCAVNTDAYKE